MEEALRSPAAWIVELLLTSDPRHAQAAHV